jgi:hypothetical protein
MSKRRYEKLFAGCGTKTSVAPFSLAMDRVDESQNEIRISFAPDIILAAGACRR